MNKQEAKEILGTLVENEQQLLDAGFDPEKIAAIRELIEDEVIEEVLDEIEEDEGSTFPYRTLAALGIETVRINYNGAGDEGWIDEITAEPDEDKLTNELEEEIKQAAYNVLEDQHAGWEINEGSQGHLTVNVRTGRTFLHHGENTIKVDYYDTEVK